MTSFLIVLITASAIAAQTTETVYQRSDLRPLNMPPTWSNGFLAVYRMNGVSVYNPDGSFRYDVERTPDDSICNVALDSDGTLAATQHHSSILVIHRTGALLKRIETPEFLPSGAVFAPDHTIWVTGSRPPKLPADTSDYNLLRHYTRTGELLGSFLKRSAFPAIDDPIQHVVALPDIHIANDRIGILLKARTHRQSLWVETDLNGKELGRWEITFDGQPITFSPEGKVYARTTRGTYVLNREQRQWQPAPISTMGTLIGSDQGTLLFADRTSPRVYRVALPPGS